MSNKFHPTKAYEAAVSALDGLRRSGDSTHIRYTDIQVRYSSGRYFVFNGSTQHNCADREDAIELVQQLCMEGRR